MKGFDRNKKISQNADKWLDVTRWRSTSECLASLKQRGFAIFVTWLGEGTVGLPELDFAGPVALVFGNESSGLRPETLAACEGTFRIPMFGFVESYNISVSVGMTLQALLPRVRARLAAEGRTGDLPPARKTALMARWLYEDVRGAPQLLKQRLGVPVT